MAGASENVLRISAIEFNDPTSGVLFDFTVSGGSHEDIEIDHNEFDDVYIVTNFGNAENTSGDVPYNVVVHSNHYLIGSSSYTQNYVWGDCDSITEFPFTLGDFKESTMKTIM